MLIQNNSDSLFTKYFSIYLKETFNGNIKVTSIYNNSTFQAINVNDQVIITGYIAYPVMISGTFQYYNYGYVVGVLGKVIDIDTVYNYTDNTQVNYISSLPYAYFDDTLNFTNCIQLDLTDTNSIILKIDVMTGELVKDNNDNYIILNDEFENVANLLVPSIYCRPQKDLCSYIYQWLNMQYPSLFDIQSYGTTINYDCNIAHYFGNKNTKFNLQKLPFDVDNLVASFILGRTISPFSTPDEIEYAQNLIRYNHYIKLMLASHTNINELNYYIKTPGMWDNLHELILIYQNNLNKRYALSNGSNDLDSYVVIPTGYLDIITEKYLLTEYEGDPNNGYYRESSNILRSN